jgi:DNA-binding response OmpR family regulator
MSVPTRGAELQVTVIEKEHGRSRWPALLATEALAVRSARIDRTLLAELDTIVPATVVIDHGTDDFDVCRVVRDVRGVFPGAIMVISQSVHDIDRHVELLEAGAGDVVAPDVPLPVLRARVLGMVRNFDDRGRIARVQLGDLDIDAEAHVVRVGGAVVPCPRLPFNLLLLLARRPNTLVTSQEIFARLWGHQVPPDPARVRGVISALRRVIGHGPERPRVASIAKVGYRLELPAQPEAGSWLTTIDGATRLLDC